MLILEWELQLEQVFWVNLICLEQKLLVDTNQECMDSLRHLMVVTHKIPHAPSPLASDNPILLVHLSIFH